MKFKKALYNSQYLEEYTNNLLKVCFELQKTFNFDDFQDYLIQVDTYLIEEKEKNK